MSAPAVGGEADGAERGPLLEFGVKTLNGGKYDSTAMGPHSRDSVEHFALLCESVVQQVVTAIIFKGQIIYKRGEAARFDTIGEALPGVSADDFVVALSKPPRFVVWNEVTECQGSPFPEKLLVGEKPEFSGNEDLDEVMTMLSASLRVSFEGFPRSQIQRG